MRKVLLLLADGFEVYEASVYIDVFGWNKTYGTKDIELVTTAIKKNITSTFGLKVEVDKTLDEITPTDYEAIAIPGGFEIYGFYKDAFSEDFKQIIRAFQSQNKTISSICTGALPIGNSGILEGRKGTTYNIGPERQDQLKSFGVNVVNEFIVEDENVVTSWSPVTAIHVAFNLLQRLTNESNVNHIKHLMGFDNPQN